MLQIEQVNYLKRLGDAIANKRMTQLELARETGVHQSQISRILSGEVRRASKNVLKLCRYAESLSVIEEAVEGTQADAIAGGAPIFGQTPAEEAAFRQVMASLQTWRQSWRREP